VVDCGGAWAFTAKSTSRLKLASVVVPRAVADVAQRGTTRWYINGAATKPLARGMFLVNLVAVCLQKMTIFVISSDTFISGSLPAVMLPRWPMRKTLQRCAECRLGVNTRPLQTSQ
jgi:hypothetical protein